MAEEKLSRDYKVNLIKAVFNKGEFESMMAKCGPYELSEVEAFLWDASLYVGRDEQGKVLTRESITSRMVPTSDYWRSQLCGEPIDTCRGRSCFVSHPVCASNKLRAQIEVIRQCFERRQHRSEQREDALLMLMMFHVNEHHYGAGGIYDTERKPVITVGSRVLDGETLAKVVNGMNWAVGSAPKADSYESELQVGEGRLSVHVRRIVFDGRELYMVLCTSLNEDTETLNKMFKRLEFSILRIYRRDQPIE
jgi:hypothetical protein